MTIRKSITALEAMSASIKVFKGSKFTSDAQLSLELLRRSDPGIVDVVHISLKRDGEGRLLIPKILNGMLSPNATVRDKYQHVPVRGSYKFTADVEVSGGELGEAFEREGATVRERVYRILGQVTLEKSLYAFVDDDLVGIAGL